MKLYTYTLVIFMCMLVSSCAPKKDPGKYTFSNIPWLTSSDEIHELFLKKGYSLDKEVGLASLYTGILLGYKANIHAIYNGDRKLVKVFVNLITADEVVFDAYASTLKILIDKYGNPTGKIFEFNYPYKYGDGYEEQAVKLGKAKVIAIWHNIPNNNELGGILLKMSQRLTVEVSYESTYWSEVSDKLQKNSDF